MAIFLGLAEKIQKHISVIVSGKDALPYVFSQLEALGATKEESNKGSSTDPYSLLGGNTNGPFERLERNLLDWDVETCRLFLSMPKPLQERFPVKVSHFMSTEILQDAIYVALTTDT